MNTFLFEWPITIEIIPFSFFLSFFFFPFKRNTRFIRLKIHRGKGENARRKEGDERRHGEKRIEEATRQRLKRYYPFKSWSHTRSSGVLLYTGRCLEAWIETRKATTTPQPVPSFFSTTPRPWITSRMSRKRMKFHTDIVANAGRRIKSLPPPWRDDCINIAIRVATYEAKYRWKQKVNEIPFLSSVKKRYR